MILRLLNVPGPTRNGARTWTSSETPFPRHLFETVNESPRDKSSVEGGRERLKRPRRKGRAGPPKGRKQTPGETKNREDTDSTGRWLIRPRHREDVVVAGCEILIILLRGGWRLGGADDETAWEILSSRNQDPSE